MKRYVVISFEKKLKLLQESCIGAHWKSLDDLKWCWHCERRFSGQSVKVYTDEHSGMWLECGTPGCNGAPIYWADYPWWDDSHPETKAHDRSELVPPP